MATEAQLADAKSKLDQILPSLAKLDAEALERAELGPLNFKTGVPVFRRVINLYRTLADCNLDDISYSKATELASTANATMKGFEEVHDFSLESQPNNPQTVRDTIIQGFRDRWEAEFAAITPAVAYAVRRGTDFDKLEREARGTLAALNTSKGQLDTAIGDVTGKMNAALVQVQDAAKKAGVAQHLAHFAEESDAYRKRSLAWLGSAGVFAAIILGYVILGVAPSLLALPDPTPIVLLQHSIPRLLIVSVLSYGLVWSARNFTAAQHNYVVNRHRRNALASFQTFVEGASDKEMKDAVLLEATHAIFMPQDSGFSKGDVPNSGSQIVEVFRSLKGGAPL
jgi:hypothetical protein